jgi:uncharacterized protein
MDAGFTAIDAHAHCGVGDRFPPQAFEDYLARVAGGPIRTVVMFPPVAEIYDRYDPNFVDSPAWQDRRRQANRYLLTAGNDRLSVIPYFFIWNDFAVEQLDDRHRGIKWHRHDDEPVYHYDDPKCAAAAAEIRRRNLPVVLEEELENTVRFVTEIARGVRVIVPHLGMLNGGYRALERRGIWEMADVWADTALASSGEIRAYIDTYGPDRLLFGSDFPFGDPLAELNKVLDLPYDDGVKRSIIQDNLERLLAGNRTLSS